MAHVQNSTNLKEMFNTLAIKTPGLLFFKFHKTAQEIWRLETILYKVDVCFFVVKCMKNNVFFFFCEF